MKLQSYHSLGKERGIVDQKQRMREIKVVTGHLPPGRDEDGSEGGIGVGNRGEE